MADDLEDAQFWLPSHFLDDDDDHPPDTTTNNEEEEEEEVVVEEEQEDKNKSYRRDGDRRKGSMAFSPPSTLYGMGSWSTSSREGSSPSSPLGGRDDPWDLPKPDEQGESHHPKRQPEAKQQKRTLWGEGRSVERAVGLTASAWPLPQPGPNAGMRAVFLQRDGQKETPGTGVFHPRSTNIGPEPRTKTKPACSTVLLPAKVVQALNVHGRLTVGSGLDPDAIFTHNVTLLQKRGLLPRLSPSQPAPSEVVVADQEIGLPSEWTYN